MAYVCAFRGPNPLSPSASSVDGLHRGEEEDIADGVGVGEQHDQAIHAEAETAGRGQDGLVRPSKAVIRCAAGIFRFLWSAVDALRFLSSRSWPRVMGQEIEVARSLGRPENTGA